MLSERPSAKERSLARSPRWHGARPLVRYKAAEGPPSPGMASSHACGEARYIYDDYYDPRAREHSHGSDHHKHHRRHRSHREVYTRDDEYPTVRQHRRHHTVDARRTAEEDPDFDDLRAPGYYPRSAADSLRDSQRMAHDVGGIVREAKPRSHRRDGTVRRKKRAVIADDRSENYVYGRPRSAGVGVIEEVTVRRSSARRRSDGAGSSRTLYSQPSGSHSASLRPEEVPKLSR